MTGPGRSCHYPACQHAHAQEGHDAKAFLVHNSAHQKNMADAPADFFSGNLQGTRVTTMLPFLKCSWNSMMHLLTNFGAKAAWQVIIGHCIGMPPNFRAPEGGGGGLLIGTHPEDVHRRHAIEGGKLLGGLWGGRRTHIHKFSAFSRSDASATEGRGVRGGVGRRGQRLVRDGVATGRAGQRGQLVHKHLRPFSSSGNIWAGASVQLNGGEDSAAHGVALGRAGRRGQLVHKHLHSGSHQISNGMSYAHACQPWYQDPRVRTGQFHCINLSQLLVMQLPHLGASQPCLTAKCAASHLLSSRASKGKTLPSS